MAEASIEVAFKGMQQNTEIMAKMMTQMRNVAVSVGITAAIWQGLEPLLRPVLTLFKMIMLLIFLPLMPYIKKLVMGMAQIATDIRAGQKEGGGVTGGIEGMLSSTGGMVLGGLIAGGFLAALTGASLGKTIALAVLAMMTVKWALGAAGADNLQSALLNAFGSGIGAAIFAKMMGLGGVASYSIGILGITIPLAIYFWHNMMESDDLMGILLNALGLSLGVGVAAFALGAGGAIAVTMGLFTLIFALAWKFNLVEKAQSLYEKVKEWVMGKAESAGRAMKGIDTSGEASYTFHLTPDTSTAETKIKNFTTDYLTDPKKNVSVSGGINAAASTWVNFSNSTTTAVNESINQLGRIPKEIVTTHIIKTVRK